MNNKANILFILACLLFVFHINLAHADFKIDGTVNDDIMYFGYCDTCNSGSPGIRTCWRSSSGLSCTVNNLVTDRYLIINGGDGNDWIKAMNNEKISHCTGSTCIEYEFNDFSNLYLTFSGVRIYGGKGNDALMGTVGRQRIDGGPDNDYIHGGEGADILLGRAGNDFIAGGAGADYIYGGTGNDVLNGGLGDDPFIDGGQGRDTFRCREWDWREIYYWDTSNVLSYHYYNNTADPSNSARLDCNDTADPSSVERWKQNPFNDWATITTWQNGKWWDLYTTSSRALMINDRAAGANILMSELGDIPVSGDFDRDRVHDDIGVFRPTTRGWYYDNNHNGTTESHTGNYGIKGDLPIAGNFDIHKPYGDVFSDDIGVFRPSSRMWYFSYDRHSGASDDSCGPWGLAGDIPLVGDFDRDSYTDDLAVYRPSSRRWYFDIDHNCTTDQPHSGMRWGLSGDIPIVGDFDSDGFNDNIALFRPSTGQMFFDDNRDGISDLVVSTFARPGYVPVAGDFDNDSFKDDIAFMKWTDNITIPSSWHFDINSDGSRNSSPPSYGWGNLGEPLAVTHKQYGSSCGPASLNMVMEYIGMADHDRLTSFYYDLDFHSPALWWAGPTGNTVDVGYWLSMEHIAFESRYRDRQLGNLDPNDPNNHWVDANFHLNVANATQHGSFWGSGRTYQIKYDIGEVHYNPSRDETNGWLQDWLVHTHSGANGGVCQQNADCLGLPYVADLYADVPDARVVSTLLGSGNNQFKSLQHIKDVVRGFIQHGIPLVVTNRDGGHFNTLVGYWDRSDGFYVYTADPLDGYGNSFEDQPYRWRKFRVTEEILANEFFSGQFGFIMLFGHHEGCLGSEGWASKIDRRHGGLLCDYLN